MMHLIALLLYIAYATANNFTRGDGNTPSSRFYSKSIWKGFTQLDFNHAEIYNLAYEWFLLAQSMESF